MEAELILMGTELKTRDCVKWSELLTDGGVNNGWCVVKELTMGGVYMHL